MTHAARNTGASNVNAVESGTTLNDDPENGPKKPKLIFVQSSFADLYFKEVELQEAQKELE